MLSTKELRVGKTYKQRNPRLAAGYDPCKTLTRKKHLRDGKYYELTFHIGKKPSGRFYNSTENPIFKRCASRGVRRSGGNTATLVGVDPFLPISTSEIGFFGGSRATRGGTPFKIPTQ